MSRTAIRAVRNSSTLVGSFRDAGLLQHRLVADEADGAGNQRQGVLLGADLPHGECIRREDRSELVLAVDLVQVDEARDIGEARKPALGKLGHARQRLGTCAQEDVLLHVAPGIAQRLDTELGLGLEALEQRFDGRLGGLLGIAEAHEADIGGLRGLACQAEPCRNHDGGCHRLEVFHRLSSRYGAPLHIPAHAFSLEGGRALHHPSVDDEGLRGHET